VSFDSVVVEVGKLTQQQIVAEAKRLNAEIMRADPKPLGFVRHVDGVEAPEEAVKVGGVIVYDYNRLDLVKKLALEILKEFSPDKTGNYIRGHQVVVDTPTEVRITNTVPYSRVIELGARGQTKLRIQKGGHVYDKTARKLRNQPEVGNSVKVEFTFSESAGASPIGAGRAERRAGQWPTLILTAM
jgi:hypothetical protein